MPSIPTSINRFQDLTKKNVDGLMPADILISKYDVLFDGPRGWVPFLSHPNTTQTICGLLTRTLTLAPMPEVSMVTIPLCYPTRLIQVRHNFCQRLSSRRKGKTSDSSSCAGTCAGTCVKTKRGSFSRSCLTPVVYLDR